MNTIHFGFSMLMRRLPRRGRSRGSVLVMAG